MSISNEEIRCPCGAPIKFSGPAQAEQAEAERPEVVGSLYLGGWADQEELEDNDVELDMKVVERLQVDLASKGDGVHMPLMTVAQHERIVGALRFERQQMDRAFTACVNERDAANARLHEVATACATAEQERDAALAEVERLRESKGDPSGSFDRCMKMMYERDENAKRLDAALARVAELETKLAELEKQEPIGWWAQYCETPMRRMVHWGAKGPECTSEEFHPFYAAPFVKAQHSVPGKYDDVLLPFLKSMEHELHANAGKGNRPGWLQMDRRTALLEIYYHLAKLQKATKDNDAAGIVEYAADVANMSMMLVDVCGLLAAAPGKEVGHE
ncbi:TPA: hypothetical protein NU583_005729 [Pseudomonas aeruginosa]|nr:hypothetical protein [Pseudomonas aeruginosa]